MFSNRIFKVLSNLVLLIAFCISQIAATPNSSINGVKKSPSEFDSLIFQNDELNDSSTSILATPADLPIQIKRASLATNGTQGNDDSGVYGSYVSGNGRYVVFGSLASNLVPDDTNNSADFFVYDVLTEETERISIASDGTQGNNVSINAVAISKDGRYVAFHSRASNLVAGDTNGHDDVFVRDRQAGVTQLVSIASNGTQGNSDSGYSYVSISDDGRFVVYYSAASNLVPNDTNVKNDVFVFDRQTNQTRRVSIASDGTQGDNHSFPVDISSDGRYIFFSSTSTNLVSGYASGGLFLFDIQTDQTTWVSPTGNSVSDNGRYIVFSSAANNLVPGDTNGVADAFVFDRQSNVTTRVSVTSDGVQGNGAVGGGCGGSALSISGDGRYVVFLSLASNLTSGDTNGVNDVFVHDNIVGTTTRVSLTVEGGQSNGNSCGGGRMPTISDDGRIVAFDSVATNLVVGDTNGKKDIFVSRVLVPWTVMVYLDGDNKDLNPHYINIFNQLENGANNSNANVIVAWDQFGNNNSAYYKVKYDTNLGQLATYTEGTDHWSKGELNMGAPATLSDFIQWARENYPAQHYALLISDHGTGINGTARDQTSNDDWITIKELGDALSTATSNGNSKLDIVFADSCLMAMIEPEYQIRNFADIYIASENLIWFPGSGSRPYTNYVTDISASTTPQELTVNIISEYSSWLNDTYPDQYGYTISAVDLTKIDPLVTAISDLSAVLQSQLPTHAAQIRSARDDSQHFDSNTNKIINVSDEYVDLADFASELKLKISDAGIQDAAQNVINGVNTYVLGNVSKPGNIVFPATTLNPNRVHGVSIFFPRGDLKRSFYNGLNLDFASDAIWNPQQSISTLSLTNNTGWGAFLVDYVSNITPSATDDPNPPDLTAPPSLGFPLVTTILRADVDSTSAQSVVFNVSFSESVANVDIVGPIFDDFTLTSIGVTGAYITDVSGSGSTYAVTVYTGSGNGTVRLDVPIGSAITDLATNSLDGLPFIDGETYTVNKPPAPKAPVLRSPRSSMITNNTTPTFWWTKVRDGVTYEIEFATDDAFISNVDNENINETTYSFISSLIDGTYFWHVRAFDAGNQPGTWSSTRTFTIDTVGPSAPTLNSPADNANMRTPTFRWDSVSGAVLYEFQYDDASDFSSPYKVATRSTFRRPPAMGLGTYYWHVRAKDAAGNWGAWSASRTITIVGP